MTSNLHGINVSTPAVVLKFDPNVMHHGGLGVIRSLGRLGVPVYGVHEGLLAPAANSRYLAGRLFWQADPGDVEQTQAGLLKLAELIGRTSVLIPTDDAGAIFLAEHGDPLREAYLFSRPPTDLPRRVADKYSMFQLCRELGVPAPRAFLPSSAEEAQSFAGLTGFPVIAKLTSPWRPGQALRSTTILRTQQELDEAWAACEQSGTGVMLQEYIPGGPERDWFFHGYCDAASVCAPAFTGRKDRSYPAHAGLTSLGRWVPDAALTEQVTEMLTALSYAGITDLDLRFDERDGRYKLLDFNPRLGAQFRLFEDTAGVDVARAAYLDLTGQPVPSGQPVPGRRFVAENYDPLGAAGYWRSGELGLKAWAGSLRGVDETAWFAADDLRPFGLMCVRMGWRMVSRPFARAASPRPASNLRYRPGRAGSGRRAQVPPGERPDASGSRQSAPSFMASQSQRGLQEEGEKV
jgi:D-aspartate ligase